MFSSTNVFENSLRGRDIISVETKNPKNHSWCKGNYHGHGNYTTKEKLSQSSPFQRNGSLRGSRRSEKLKKCDSAKSETSQKSANSEGASESDSLDSVKNFESVDERKTTVSSDVCNRLFSNGTKASEAKMRHLDIFDLDDTSWESALPKNKPARPKVSNSDGFSNIPLVLIPIVILSRK
ncbi:hypothetical protein HHI36_022092 [Cryptolaemus montrouzieri]|uniref:Uncharacterized protein n=1 Tax=Cryptolaemus montrouzieri TaxID=559131 RepID=A0ABD2MZM7_9CUCU